MRFEMDVDLSTPEEMVLTRLFDAPRDLVWQCWTDPAHLAVWWGPANVTNKSSIDLKPGGKWDQIMLGPSGEEYPMRASMLEIIEGQKLVSRIGGSDHPQGDIIDGIIMTVTFEDTDDGKTLVTVTQRFATRSLRDANMDMGARQGWSESFVKLDTLLTELVAR